METKFNYKKICQIRYSLINSEHGQAHNIVICWGTLFIKMVGYLLKSPSSFKKVEEVLVVIPSANNRRSIQPILDTMQHKNYTCVDRFYNFLPMGKICLKSIIHFGSFMKFYISSTKKEKYLIRAHFGEFAPAKDLYEAIGEFYNYNPQIKILIVSNDHIPVMRSFIDQARNHGIKSLYSQHASVSEFFPPLEFDYSFLDGMESYLKYKAISPIRGKAFLAGSPRFDVITQLKKQQSNLIGIAFNQLDNIDKILELVKKLRECGFEKIVVRPHPQQDKNNPDWSMFTDEGCEVSHPLQENPFKFISRLSFLISGASSIHLEAALLRIPSVIFNMQTFDGNLDYYGYGKQRLTPIAATSDEVVSLIKEPYLPSIETIRYYDAAFETDYDGKSASLAAQVIDAFLDGNETKTLTSLFKKSQEGYYVIK